MSSFQTAQCHAFRKLDPAATGNRTHKSSWSVLGPPYRRLLRSAGDTEDPTPDPHRVKSFKRSNSKIKGNFSSHSLRRGGTTAMRAAGVPLSHIKEICYQRAPSGAPTPDPHGAEGDRRVRGHCGPQPDGPPFG